MRNRTLGELLWRCVAIPALTAGLALAAPAAARAADGTVTIWVGSWWDPQLPILQQLWQGGYQCCAFGRCQYPFFTRQHDHIGFNILFTDGDAVPVRLMQYVHHQRLCKGAWHCQSVSDGWLPVILLGIGL